jgi:hypothetical protein
VRDLGRQVDVLPGGVRLHHEDVLFAMPTVVKSLTNATLFPSGDQIGFFVIAGAFVEGQIGDRPRVRRVEQADVQIALIGDFVLRQSRGRGQHQADDGEDEDERGPDCHRAPLPRDPGSSTTLGCRQRERVADRIRTGDRLDHNQELYQLSYSHHAVSNLPGRDWMRGTARESASERLYAVQTRTRGARRATAAPRPAESLAGPAAKSISSSTGPRFSRATSRA